MGDISFVLCGLGDFSFRFSSGSADISPRAIMPKLTVFSFFFIDAWNRRTKRRQIHRFEINSSQSGAPLKRGRRSIIYYLGLARHSPNCISALDLRCSLAQVPLDLALGRLVWAVGLGAGVCTVGLCDLIEKQNAIWIQAENVSMRTGVVSFFSSSPFFA